MHRSAARPSLVLLLACALALPLAACGDGPTAPTSFAQEVGGRLCVAVAPPDGLSDGARRALRIGGLGLGVAGLVLLGFALRRARG